MPSLKTTLKILSAVALMAVFSLAVVSGPTVSYNPLGMYDDNADYELKAQLAPVHILPGQPEEEIAISKTAQMMRGTASGLTTLTDFGADRDVKSVYLQDDFESYDPEGTFPIPGWTQYIQWTAATWRIGTTNVPNSTQSLLCPWANPLEEQDEWIITPLIDVSGANTTLAIEFNYVHNNDTYPYELDLMVSTTGIEKTDFSLLWAASAEAHENMTWTVTTVSLSAFAGETIYLAWRFYGDDTDVGCVDDIMVYDESDPEPGRCCYGEPAAPMCADELMVECEARVDFISWDGALNCTADECEPFTGPTNDECVTAIDVTGAYPVVVDGSTVGANGMNVVCDEATFDYDATVWYKFDVPAGDLTVTLDFCNTPEYISSISATLWDQCDDPCVDPIFFSAGSFYDCGGAFNVPTFDFAVVGPTTLYYAVAATAGKSEMPFHFTVDVVILQSSDNNNCGEAMAVGDGSYAFNTDEDTFDGEGTCMTSPNIWYVYTAAITGDATASLCASSFDTKMAVYDGSTCSPLSALIECNDDASCDKALQSSVTFAAVAGNEYLIEVGGYSSNTGDGVLDLSCIPYGAGACCDPAVGTCTDVLDEASCLAMYSGTGVYTSGAECATYTCPPPATAGDNCEDPLSVKLPDDMTSGAGSDEYWNTSYTCGRWNNYEETALGYYDGGEDMIYMLDVGSDMTVDIFLDPLGTGYSGIILSSTCPDDGTSITYSTAYSGAHAIYGVDLTAGFYYIMIDTWPTPDCIPVFDLVIATAGEGPANDDFANCEPVFDGVEIAFSTTVATFDGPGGCLDSPNIWYCYEATCDGMGTFSLCGSGFDTKMAVYEGTDPFTATQIGCNDDATCAVKALQSEVVAGVTAGNTYLIEVGGYSSNVGEGVLNVSCLYCPAPENDLCGDVTPVPMTGGTPVSFSGDLTCATADMAGLDAEGYTWHAFTTTSTMDFSVRYCGMSPAFLNGFIVIFGSCDYADIYYAVDWDFTSCGDGNATINWYGMAPGTYYYPVMKDGANSADGPYTIEFLGNALSDLSVDPSVVDFGVQAEGSTGGLPITLTSSGGTSDINFSVSYSYSTKGRMPGGYTEMGTEATDVVRGDYTGPDYVNPTTKQGGDDIASAFVLPTTLPITSTGTTSGYVHDYDEECTFSGSTAPDVVYSFTPDADVSVDMDLCNSTYDTKLYVYENSYTPGAPFACNDDACPGYMSELLGLALVGGNTYYIVVDGYGDEEGPYELNIAEEFVPEPFDCPEGAGLESEACGEDLNGGCNATPMPVFESINCGDLICGTIWADGGTRDTDWYLLTLYSETVITLTGSGNFDFVIGFVDTSDCGLAAALDPYATGAPNTIQTISRTAGPGTYVAFVSHQLYEGSPCGNANDYWILLDCPEGPVTWVSADPESGTIAPGGSFPMDINFNAAGLEEGIHTATVNITHDGGKAEYNLPVSIEIGTGTPPVLVVDPPAINFGAVHEGDAGSYVMNLSNGGSGTIEFSLGLDYGVKSVDGSYMFTNGSFTPGATQNIEFGIYAMSDDWEYVTYAELEFPAGFTVNGQSDMTWMGARGIVGQEAQWGDSGSYALGYLYNEFDYATVNVTSDGGLTTDQTINYYVYGEDYGAPPYGVSGSFVLPLYLDPLLSWCTIDVTDGTLGDPVDVTVSYNATGLPAGTHTCNIIISDDTRGTTTVPVTISVYEYDGVAIAPDPILAIEQNATGTNYGYIYLGDDFAGLGYDGADVTGVVGLDANGTALTVTGSFPGSHPLVFGDAYVVEFVLNDFAAAYGWPTGMATEMYNVTVSTTGGDFVITDGFLYAGHVSGDLTMDGFIDITDLIMMVNYMFQGGDAPQVMATMNINGDEQIADIADLIYLVTYMFQGGPAPLYAD
jgi:hypothetical protein